MAVNPAGPRPPISVYTSAAGRTAPAAAASRFARFDRIRDTLMAQSDVLGLRNVIENNPWHRTDVLSHTERVANGGRQILELSFLTEPVVQERLSSYLYVIIDANSSNRYSRAELAYAAMFLHDIGKGMINPKTGQPVLQVDGTGKTTALGHGPIGAPRAAEIAREALGCSDTEAAYIGNIVKLHMEGFNLAAAITKGDAKKGRTVAQHEETVRAEFLGKIGYDPVIMLQTMADLSGSAHDISADITLQTNLITSIFKIPRQVLRPQAELGKEFATAVSDLAKKHGVILVPGCESRERLLACLKASLMADFAQRVADGKVKADKVAGIVANLLAGLESKIEFRPGENSADAVENAFDFNKELSRNPVILMLS